MKLLLKKRIGCIMLFNLLSYFSFSQTQIDKQLVYKTYDTLRNNKVIHEYTFPFETSEVQIEGNSWTVSVEKSNSLAEGAYIQQCTVKMQLKEGESSPSSWGVTLVQNNWDRENYVLMPGVVYQGNRFKSRKIPYSPKLKDHRDIGADIPTIINDIPRLNIGDGPSKIQLNSGSMSVPSLGFTNKSRTKAYWLFSPQENAYGDYLYRIEESGDRKKSWITISSPAVREEVRYGFCTMDAPSKDKPAIFKKGDEITLEFWWIEEEIEDLSDFFKNYQHWENIAVGANDNISALIPFSAAFEIHQKKFNKENWKEKYGYYAIGTPQTNFLQDWQIGWTGGMITTYPFLMLGNDETRSRTLRQFDWIFPDGFAPSGVFWENGEKGTKWYGGDIRFPQSINWHLARKGGDGLYFVVKQLMLMEKMWKEVPLMWKSKLKAAFDAYASVWKNDKQFGQFIDTEKLEIVVGGSTSGAIFPAAFMLASKYYSDESYKTIAEESARHFYQSFTKEGLTTGGPGDALQAPDSESAFALVVSYMTLFEETKNEAFLQMAKEATDQFLTWVVGYNYRFPEQSTYSKEKRPSLGAIYANSQNTTAPVGICTYSGLDLLKLYRATGEEIYLKTLIDITRVMGHHLSFGERILPEMKEGWMTERVNMNDGLGEIGEYLPYSSWAETSHMLAITELPSIYVDLEKEKVFSIDHVEATLIKKGRRLILKIENPTDFKASITVVAEDKDTKVKSWNDFFRLDAQLIEIEVGGNKEVRLN